jgi:hypothetical protein
MPLKTIFMDALLLERAIDDRAPSEISRRALTTQRLTWHLKTKYLLSYSNRLIR